MSIVIINIIYKPQDKKEIYNQIFPLLTKDKCLMLGNLKNVFYSHKDPPRGLK